MPAVLIFIAIVSCNQNTEATNTNQLPGYDTLYSVSPELKHLEDISKRLVIHINTVPPEKQLVVGVTDTISITIKRMEGYPIIIKKSINCELNQLENDLFTFKPAGVNCSFEVWQDYDSGNVILNRKTLLNDSLSVKYTAINGTYVVGRVNMSKYVVDKLLK